MVQITQSSQFSEVYLFTPEVFQDERGFFLESFRDSWFDGIAQGLRFVQDNHSLSKKHALRGLHYQLEKPQGKLIRVIEGQVFDVMVDMRKNSKTFGQWQGFNLDAKIPQLLWIPPGFAHGFYTLSEKAQCLYRCTEYYHPQSERCLHYADKTLNIAWPLSQPPIVSAKDLGGKSFLSADYF